MVFFAKSAAEPIATALGGLLVQDSTDPQGMQTIIGLIFIHNYGVYFLKKIWFFFHF